MSFRRMFIEFPERWRWSREHRLFNPRDYKLENNLKVGDWLARLHFCTLGALSDLSFGPILQVTWYREIYSDVAECRMTTAYHYLKFGIFENRQPNALFQPEHCYRIGKCDSTRPAILNYLGGSWRTGCQAHPLVDEAYISREHESEEAGLLVYLRSPTEIRCNDRFEVRQ